MSETDNPAIKEPPYHEIFTERLKLRTLHVSDAERLMPILTSKDVMQWTTKPPVEDLSQAERWIKDRALGQDVFNFAIELRDAGPNSSKNEVPIMGVAGTFHIPKIGYLIHPAHWGKGIASEALAALVPATFERFPSTRGAKDDSYGGLDYVEGWIDIDNAASQRVLEKCEFVLCEELDAPPDAPGYVKRVAVLRRARDGMSLEEMGLLRREGEDGEGERLVPPVQ